MNNITKDMKGVVVLILGFAAVLTVNNLLISLGSTNSLVGIILNVVRVVLVFPLMSVLIGFLYERLGNQKKSPYFLFASIIFPIIGFFEALTGSGELYEGLPFVAPIFVPIIVLFTGWLTYRCLKLGFELSLKNHPIT